MFPDVFGINTSNCDISKKDDIDKWFYDFESVDILVNVALSIIVKK